jgi:hypothetical protein
MKYLNSNLKLMAASFLQVTLVSANITFISRNYVMLMIITGFGISYLWATNVKKIALGKHSEKLIYACGAAAGTGFGYYFSHLLIFLIEKYQ